MQLSAQCDLRGVVEGDRNARRHFIQQFDRMVWKAARAVGLRGRDLTAADVYQELWAHVFENDCRLIRAYSGRHGATFATYLANCLARKALSVGRRVSCSANALRRAAEADPEAGRGLRPYHPPRPDAECERRERDRLLAMVHDGLPPRSREFFDLAVLGDRSVAEVQQAFNLPSANAVYQHRCRVLGAVRQRFAALDGR